MSGTRLDPKLVSHLDLRSPGAEAFRVLRTNLQFMALDQPLRSLLITSASPDEGKTLTACNLAVTFAKGGQRVLLVDGDLRRPAVHKVFDLPRAWAGLTTVLASREALRDVIVQTPIPDLYVLPSGPIPPSPAEVLGSTRMGEVLREATANFDLVIIDSPPVLAVTDPCVLAAQVDGVGLVVRAGRVTRPQVRQAKQALEAVHARLLGVIIGSVTRSDGSDYYYYYYYDEKHRTSR